MKRCTKCGEEKPLSEFYDNKRGRDGKQSWCKSCMCEYSHEYNQRRAANPLAGCFKSADELDDLLAHNHLGTTIGAV